MDPKEREQMTKGREGERDRQRKSECERERVRENVECCGFRKKEGRASAGVREVGASVTGAEKEKSYG
jgi:hypothetical protein